MSIAFAILGAVGSCAGLWAAGRLFFQTEETPSKGRRVLWAAAALLGALGGYAIPRTLSFWPDMVRLLCVLVLLAGAARCDLACRRIPNPLSLAMLAVAVLGAAANLIAFGRDGLVLAGGSLLSAAVMFGVLMLCRFFSRGGIGYGDIKIISALAAALGLYGVIGTLLAAQIAALLAALLLLALRRIRFRDSLPFAPFLYLGYIVWLWLRMP